MKPENENRKLKQKCSKVRALVARFFRTISFSFSISIDQMIIFNKYKRETNQKQLESSSIFK